MKPNPAFLLAQVGAHSAEVFARLLGPLHISPAHSGVVWLLERSPGITQQEMASTLRVHPSRLVTLLDELEKGGYIERRGNDRDRRANAVHLTASGQTLFANIQKLAQQHQDIVCAALTDAERRRMAELLVRIAQDRELAPAVHPGYRWLGRRVKTRE